MNTWKWSRILKISTHTKNTVSIASTRKKWWGGFLAESMKTLNEDQNPHTDSSTYIHIFRIHIDAWEHRERSRITELS